MAKELIFKQRSYKLVELAETQLGEPGHIALDVEEVAAQYQASDRLVGLVRLNEDDARLVMRLAERVKMLSLTKQLTQLVGNIWSRTLTGHRAERVEFLLLHEFHRVKFVVPDRRPGPSGPGAGKRKKKAAYAGGMVLEPRIGFYDRLVVLLDFKSLYPSLIQEYNVCFTTVQRKPVPVAAAAPGAKAPDQELPWIAEPPERGGAEGILPRVVRSLVEQRRRVRT
jgi:DNA polymerase alpha subunit A